MNKILKKKKKKKTEIENYKIISKSMLILFLSLIKAYALIYGLI